MKLTYRGISYEKNVHSVETCETNIFIKYRGVTYNYRRSMTFPQPESKVLKYRGVAYNLSEVNSSPQPVEQKPASTSIPLLQRIKLVFS